MQLLDLFSLAKEGEIQQAYSLALSYPTARLRLGYPITNQRQFPTKTNGDQ